MYTTVFLDLLTNSAYDYRLSSLLWRSDRTKQLEFDDIYSCRNSLRSPSKKNKYITIFLSIIMQIQTEIFLVLFVRHIYILRGKSVSCYVCACEMSFNFPCPLTQRIFLLKCVRCQTPTLRPGVNFSREEHTSASTSSPGFSRLFISFTNA